MTGRNGLTVSSIPLLRDVGNFSPAPPPTPAPPGQRLAAPPRPEVLPYGGANLWIPGAGSAVLLGSGLLLRSYSGRARVRGRGTDGLPGRVGRLRLAPSALVAAGV